MDSGNPQGSEPGRRASVKPRSAAERFAKFIPSGVAADACWEWTGAKCRGGYGVFQALSKRTVKAHRFSYELSVGPIPAGLCVCHRCDNPPCINPAHLFLGTPADNNRDRHQKGRSRTYDGPRPWLATIRREYVRASSCKRGHPFDDGNTRRGRDGSRQCRTCEQLREEQRKDRRRRSAMAGKRKYPGASSRFYGVCWNSRKGRWRAYIVPPGHRPKHLGWFEIETEAAKARDVAAALEFGPRARLNFPTQ